MPKGIQPPILPPTQTKVGPDIGNPQLTPDFAPLSDGLEMGTMSPIDTYRKKTPERLTPMKRVLRSLTDIRDRALRLIRGPEKPPPPDPHLVALKELDDARLFQFVRSDLEEIMRHPDFFAQSLLKLHRSDPAMAESTLHRMLMISRHAKPHMAEKHNHTLLSLAAFIRLQPKIAWSPDLLMNIKYIYVAPGHLCRLSGYQMFKQAVNQNPELIKALKTL